MYSNGTTYALLLSMQDTLLPVQISMSQGQFEQARFELERLADIFCHGSTDGANRGLMACAFAEHHRFLDCNQENNPGPYLNKLCAQISQIYNMLQRKQVLSSEVTKIVSDVSTTVETLEKLFV